MQARAIPLLLGVLLTAPAFALDNQLGAHPSPYLAMHGQDPVAWQDWGEAAVDLARAEDKLLFVSSGYFSCHWCHVMQRESYQNDAIADILNRHFVPVKLDRELHGALDAHLISFVEKTQGRAGWPLNVFLTPEGYPLIGATYLTPERFQALLLGLNKSWRDERGRLRNLARRTLLELTLDTPPEFADPWSAPALKGALLEQTLTLADPLAGGFGDQSRFPMAPQLLMLLDLQAQAPDQRLAEFLILTLDSMATQGLRDHLAGGFFRYTVDPTWQIPHFEKMLYTQALLAEVYLRASQVFGRDDYAAVARDTLAFVIQEMGGPQGSFVASFSAVDGAGKEGGVYLWSIDQLHRLLGEQDTALARRYWRMLDIAALDGGHLPRRGESVSQIAEAIEQPDEAVMARLQSIRERLLDTRSRRVLPVDQKELAGWNGLLLASLSRAALAWDDPEFRAAADRVRDFLRNRLWDGAGLRRAMAGDRALGKATLEDYAYVAYGMAQYARLSGDPADRTFVAVLLNLAWQRFHGPGGWRRDDQPLIPGLGDEPALLEGPLPAPSAVLIRLALNSDDPALAARAASAAAGARPQAQAEPFWYAGHLAALLALPPAEP